MNDDDYYDDPTEEIDLCKPCCKWACLGFLEGKSGLRWVIFLSFLAWNLQLASLLGCDYFRVHPNRLPLEYASVGFFKRHVNVTEIVDMPGTVGCINYADGEHAIYINDKQIVLTIVATVMTALVLIYVTLARLGIVIHEGRQSYCLATFSLIAGIIMCIPQAYKENNLICKDELDKLSNAKELVPRCTRGISGKCGLAGCILWFFIGIFLLCNSYFWFAVKEKEDEAERKRVAKCRNSRQMFVDDPEMHARMENLRNSLNGNVTNGHGADFPIPSDTADLAQTQPRLIDTLEGTTQPRLRTTQPRLTDTLEGMDDAIPIAEVILSRGTRNSPDNNTFGESIAVDDLSLEESFRGQNADDDLSFAETINKGISTKYDRSTSIATMDSMNISSNIAERKEKVREDNSLSKASDRSEETSLQIDAKDPSSNERQISITEKGFQGNTLSMTPKDMSPSNERKSITEVVRLDSTLSMNPMNLSPISMTEKILKDNSLSMAPDIFEGISSEIGAVDPPANENEP